MKELADGKGIDSINGKYHPNRRKFLLAGSLAIAGIGSSLAREAFKTEQQKLEELLEKYPSKSISRVVYDPELNVAPILASSLEINLDINPYSNPHSVPARIVYTPSDFGKQKPLVVYFLRGTFEELVYNEHKINVGRQGVEINSKQKSLLTYLYGKSLAESIAEGRLGEISLDQEKFSSMRADIRKDALRANALIRTYDFLKAFESKNPATLYAKNKLAEFMAYNYNNWLQSPSTLNETEAKVIRSLSASYYRAIRYN